MISQLYENNSLSASQAKRMVWFCINSGPAFVVGAVGTTMLSSKKCGILLFASQTLAALIIGFFSRFFAEKKGRENDKVIQLVNRAEKGIMNGDVGYISHFKYKNLKSFIFFS